MGFVLFDSFLNGMSAAYELINTEMWFINKCLIIIITMQIIKNS